MSRGLHSSMVAALQSSAVRPYFLVDLNFTSPIYLWSGNYTLDISGTDYVGAGELLQIEIPEETQDIGAVGVKLTMSGLANSILSPALQQEYQGKTVVMKLGGFDANGTIVSGAVTIFEGFMDTMQITEGAETSTITLYVENKLIRLDSANERRYTDQDQRIDHPSDRGFEFVTDIQEKQIKWGT